MAAVIWEDEDLIAFDKPPGVHSAPLRAGEGGSLLEEAMGLRPAIARLKGRKPVEPGLLHRLDRDTSGIVLIAKTDFAFDALLSLQAGGGFKKEYDALCARSDPDLPGARPPRGNAEGGSVASRFRSWGPGAKRVAPLDAGDGEVYRTDIIAMDEGPVIDGTALFRLTVGITRGFRHQVRVHLAWLGLPILGDVLYAPAVFKEWRAEGRTHRLMLHASAVEFLHPRSSSPLRLECPPPPEFGS